MDSAIAIYIGIGLVVCPFMLVGGPAVAGILNALLDDLRVLPNRRDAFENPAQRSTTDGLRRFGTMIRALYSRSLLGAVPGSHLRRSPFEEKLAHCGCSPLRVS